MTAITSAAGAIDVQTLVSQLMSVERMPADTLDSKISTQQKKISAYGQIKSKFDSLASAAWDLSLSSGVNSASFSATSTDATVIQASASSASAASTHAMTVQALAQNHSISTKEFASATTGIVTGDFDITVGGTTKKISLNNASLNDVASAINGSGSGVNASVVYGSTGYRLMVTSKNSGASNAISMGLSAAQTAAPSGDADFTFGGAGTMTQNVAAQDAKFVMDGVNMTRSSNVVSDAVSGVALSLQKVSASPVTVTVGLNSAGLKDKLGKFVDAYNSLISYVKTNAPTGTGTTGPLKNDTSINSMMLQVRNAITGTYGPSGSAQLSSIGVKFQRDGTLSLASASLDSAVTNNYSGVVSLLATGTGGGSGAMKAISDRLTQIEASDGALGARTSGLNKALSQMQGERTGWDEKLATKQSALIKQYSALNGQVSQMQTMLTNLTAQFSKLS